MMRKLMIGIWFCMLSFILGGQVNTVSIENVYLVTDRTLYVAGEKIFFSAIVDAFDEDEGSKILYVEIVTPQGKQIAGNKFLIGENKAKGCLLIPAEIISGVYSLRAYTKFMRNLSPETFAYVAVKIVNPMKEEVSQGTLTLENSPDHHDGNDFIIKADKEQYGPHEVASVEVQYRAMQPIAHAVISVVPVHTMQSEASQGISESTIITTDGYLPETRGVSLTGLVRYDSVDQPIPGARVNLSIIGHGRDFMATEADEEGRYFFSLPDYSGNRDLFISTSTIPGVKTKLLVDNDFSTTPLSLPSYTFHLNTEERNAALTLGRNNQLHQHYRTDTLLCPNPYELGAKTFYSKPTDAIIFDEYIALPTLEEYINELTTAVKVRKQDGQKYFKVLGNLPEMAARDPLVLIDWVAVDNPALVLAASPNAIERVEFINVPYVKGDITYGGVISIISKRGDFAGIDLPSSGIFLNYQFRADTCTCLIQDPSSSLFPDARNTIYWEPDIHLEQHNPVTISFLSPETPGQYVIYVNGFDVTGKYITSSRSFEVTNLK